MKKIFIGIILLIVTFLVVNFFTYFVTKAHYKEFNHYKILTQDPQIEILESKASYTKGYIKGRATNTTTKMMDCANVKITIYNEKGEYLDTKYHTIPYFAPNETVQFELKYEYKNVGKIEIEVIETSLEEEKVKNNLAITDVEFAPYLIVTLMLINPVIIFTALGI